MNFQRNLRFFALLILTLVTCMAWPQVSTSRIEGTVTDKSNAVVPGASVQAINESTGVRYDTKTSSSGTYTIPSVTPGLYTITVIVKGFETFTSQHNVLIVVFNEV